MANFLSHYRSVLLPQLHEEICKAAGMTPIHLNAASYTSFALYCIGQNTITLNPQRSYYTLCIDEGAQAFRKEVRSKMDGNFRTVVKEHHIKAAWATLMDVMNATATLDNLFQQIGNELHPARKVFHVFLNEILDYLKEQLVQLYLEMQNHGTNHDPYTREEVYQCYFDQLVIPPCVEPAEAKETPSPPASFTVRKGDFRPRNPKVLLFDDVVQANDLFTTFEHKLHEAGYIDNAYTFTTEHGKLTHLVKIIHLLIPKGYFRSRRIVPGTRRQVDVKDYHIARFMGHRYGVDIDKLFSNYRYKQEEVKEFGQMVGWLDNLPGVPGFNTKTSKIEYKRTKI